MSRIPARQAVRLAPLDVDRLRKTMRRSFPKRNNFGDASVRELIEELSELGIQTLGQFERLMKRHRRRLLEIDAAPMDSWHARYHARYHARELGEAVVQDCLRKRYWFAYPALVRIATELQYGEATAESVRR